MSLGGSLSGISFAGLGSGIDTQSIITQLMQIEAIPVNRMKANQATLQARLSIYDQLKSKVTSLRIAASSLNTASSFSPITGSVTDATVASISVGASATAGTFSLWAEKLAQANKVLSTSQTASDTALNLAGDFIVNGKHVNIVATDTLANVASKVNSAGAGVTASIIGGSGAAYLSLTGSETGAANKIQLADESGTVLSSLGVLNGAATLREPITDGFRSFGFTSATGTLASMTGSHKSGSFTIGTEVFNVDFDTDTLQSIAASITSAFSGQGLTASVVDATVGSKTVKKIEVTGLGANALVDTDGILADLGVLQQGFGNEVVAARNSEFKVDGIALTNYSNSVANAINGVTVNLLKDETQGAATTNINLSRDNSKVKDTFKSYMSAFNDLVDYVKINSSFDAKTFQTGPLFGDTATNQLIAGIQTALFQQVTTGTNVTNLTDLGFGIDSDGKMTLDEGQLDKALATDIDSVKKIMISAGSSSNTEIAFVSSTSRTQDSGTLGYSVSITQAATKSKTRGSVVPTTTMGVGEVLSFTGANFSTKVDFNVTAGKTLAEVVAAMNADSRLKDKVVASVDVDGKLKVEAVKYGSAADFVLASNIVAGVDNTGIGTTGAEYLKGFDVAGTLNGEAAVGTGQYLIGKDTNATTAGLQIQYTGTATGDIGIVNFSRGLTNRMLGAIDNIVDGVNGVLTAQTKAIQSQVDDLTDRIASYSDTLLIRQQTLQAKFLAMEQAISAMQSQQAQLSKALGTS